MNYYLISAYSLLLIATLTKINNVSCNFTSMHFHNLTLDFSPFNRIIEEILIANMTTDERIDFSKECNIPEYGIMFSYTNHHMFDFLLLQRKAMEIGKVRKCLEQRFITVCFDPECMVLCSTHGISNCVEILFPIKLPFSDFGKEGYSYFTWIKHELMYHASKSAKEIFFFDIDVIILRNPWPWVKFGRDQYNGTVIEGVYDIQYQRERGLREKGCGGSVNSGQMYIRNSTALQTYFQKLFESKEEIIIKRERLDQDFVGDLVGLLRYCTFPVQKFLGHCLASKDSSAPLSGVVSYHTSCANGNEKKKLLERFLFVATKRPNGRVGEVG